MANSSTSRSKFPRVINPDHRRNPYIGNFVYEAPNYFEPPKKENSVTGGPEPEERLPTSHAVLGTFRHAPPVRGVESLETRTGVQVHRGVLDILSFNADDIAMSIAQARSNLGLGENVVDEQGALSSLIATPNNEGGGMLGFNMGGMMGVITRMAAASAMHRKRLHVTPEELERLPVMTFEDLLRGGKNSADCIYYKNEMCLSPSYGFSDCGKFDRFYDKTKALHESWVKTGRGGPEDWNSSDPNPPTDEGEWENVGVNVHSQCKHNNAEHYHYSPKLDCWGNSSDYTNGQSVCVICTDEFESMDTLRQLPCRHIFHRKCVDRWLLGKHSSSNTRTTNCPICKEDVRIKRKSQLKRRHRKAKELKRRKNNINWKHKDDDEGSISSCSTGTSSSSSPPPQNILEEHGGNDRQNSLNEHATSPRDLSESFAIVASRKMNVSNPNDGRCINETVVPIRTPNNEIVKCSTFIESVNVTEKINIGYEILPSSQFQNSYSENIVEEGHETSLSNQGKKNSRKNSILRSTQFKSKKYTNRNMSQSRRRSLKRSKSSVRCEDCKRTRCASCGVAKWSYAHIGTTMLNANTMCSPENGTIRHEDAFWGSSGIGSTLSSISSVSTLSTEDSSVAAFASLSDMDISRNSNNNTTTPSRNPGTYSSSSSSGTYSSSSSSGTYSSSSSSTRSMSGRRMRGGNSWH